MSGMQATHQLNVINFSCQWLGFGPEQLSIPEGFTLPVSSFSEYGGHASINIRYDAMTMDAFYKKGDNAPGNNVAYLQGG
mmetsp:Transcript_49977/g.150330  ORF Transcript_49977/g.150330 Transcript_49977/m.150330 type:complete len:80 (-) Transcript_49977:1001-1240(-)